MKILIIDDADVESLVRVLGLLLPDAELVVVRTADEIVSDAWPTDIDYVLLDVMMYPGTKLGNGETDAGFLTGTVLLRHVKIRVPTVPISILTALKSPYFEKVKESCANDPQVREVWPKPTSPRIIAEDILAAVEEKGGES